jgi:hypothetical protein
MVVEKHEITRDIDKAINCLNRILLLDAKNEKAKRTLEIYNVNNGII